MDDARTVQERVPDVLRWLQRNCNDGDSRRMVTHNGVLRRLFGVVDAPRCELRLYTGSQNTELANISQVMEADL